MNKLIILKHLWQKIVLGFLAYFIFFSAVVVVGGLAVISKMINWIVLPIVIIGGILIIGIIGALQLKNDDKLKEENFLKLMIETYKKLPLLKGK